MNNYYGGDQNLAERIEEAFIEIESETGVYLRENDNEFAKMWKEHIELQKKYPIVVELSEPNNEVYKDLHLSAEEHEALVKYLGIKCEMERMEKKRLYFRGHKDSFNYLIKVVGIHNE